LIRAAAIAGFLAALLAVDTQVELPGQLLLGALTWIVLLVAARPLPAERRAQVTVVICAATVAEVTGSILWGVYSHCGVTHAPWWPSLRQPSRFGACLD
jgi:hypothetical protein